MHRSSIERRFSDAPGWPAAMYHPGRSSYRGYPRCSHPALLARCGTGSLPVHCAALHTPHDPTRSRPAPARPCDRACRWRSPGRRPSPRTPPAPCSRAIAATDAHANGLPASRSLVPPHRRPDASAPPRPPPAPPPRAPPHARSGALRSRPAQCGTRAASPDDRCDPETPHCHRAGSAPDRRCDTSAHPVRT